MKYDEDSTLHALLTAISHIHSQQVTTQLTDISPNKYILGDLSPKSVTSEEVHKYFLKDSLRTIL